MKLNEPTTKEEHVLANVKHQRLKESQRELKIEAADLLMAGKPLRRLQAGIVDAILREDGNTGSTSKRKRPAGRPTKIPDISRVIYAGLIAQTKMSQTAALKFIADLYDVTPEAVMRKMGMRGTEHEKQLAAEEMRKAFLLV